MAKEIEVVILDINKKEIINKLKKLNAKKLFEGNIKDIFFENKKQSLKKKGKILRIRSFNSKKHILTLKENPIINDFKIKDEYETQILDISNLKKILFSLDYSIKKTIIKKRISYKIENVYFDIQKIKSIPYYLEIESINKSKIISYAKKLGFLKKDLKSYSLSQIKNIYLLK